MQPTRTKKIPSKIKLHALSRTNRMFMDGLIRLLAIEMALGTKALDPDEIVPSYKGFDWGDGRLIQLARIRWILPDGKISQLSRMMEEESPARTLSDFRNVILRRTDLTDCHLTSLNDPPLEIYDRLAHPEDFERIHYGTQGRFGYKRRRQPAEAKEDLE